MNISTTIPFSVRLQLHLIAFLAVIFLGIYGKIVCPFIDSVTIIQLAMSLGIVTVFHLILREILFNLSYQTPKISLARFGFYLSIISWIITGIIAMIVHGIIYPTFPLGSHIKLMVGYWALGAGMLAQLEYAMFERHIRKCCLQQYTSDRLAKRLLESFMVFTIVPTMAMFLLVARYIYEGIITIGVGIEILFLSLFLVCIALIVARYWGKTLQEDTDNILQGLSNIGGGHFDTTLNVKRADELGQVAYYINDMAHGLGMREKIKEAFGRFVSPEIAEKFIQDYVQDGKTVKMGGERTEVTILMCDLRNFTPLSETLNPVELTELLNAYFSEMVTVIRSNNGMVDKFIGDAIMAVFGINKTEENHCELAVQAAISMRKSLEDFNDKHPNLPTLQNGVGIHCGEVVAGYIGSVDRLEFTVIGRAVNIAARIESQTKSPNPPILFSQEVADRISLPLIKVGMAQLKGVEQAVSLFSVSSL
ncbi:adenylate/guanylate cyclase domain-containing protein [Thiotrichales bacterium HSG1]|nr:adenylate/guanylate cyclase domain-containing protein [Thiotrichales bacterium HSG1]